MFFHILSNTWYGQCKVFLFLAFLQKEEEEVEDLTILIGA
jgi:hypothetical protein